MKISDKALDEFITTLEAVKGTGVRQVALVLTGPTGAIVAHTHVGDDGEAELAELLEEVARDMREDT